MIFSHTYLILGFVRFCYSEAYATIINLINVTKYNIETCNTIWRFIGMHQVLDFKPTWNVFFLFDGKQLLEHHMRPGEILEHQIDLQNDPFCWIANLKTIIGLLI